MAAPGSIVDYNCRLYTESQPQRRGREPGIALPAICLWGLTSAPQRPPSPWHLSHVSTTALSPLPVAGLRPGSHGSVLRQNPPHPRPCPLPHPLLPPSAFAMQTFHCIFWFAVLEFLEFHRADLRLDICWWLSTWVTLIYADLVTEHACARQRKKAS